jgi:predicted nucleic acid-binding protein
MRRGFIAGVLARHPEVCQPWARPNGESEDSRASSCSRRCEPSLDADGFVIQDPPVAHAALSTFRASKADFSDCLILAVVQSAGAAPLATVDDKLAKLPGTRRLGGKKRRR